MYEDTKVETQSNNIKLEPIPYKYCGFVHCTVWPKLKVDATEVAAAGAGVEAAEVDCPKLNIPPPDVALGASLVDGASGFLPKAPKAEDGAEK